MISNKSGLTNNMRGNYCEFDDNGKNRFIEVYTIKYDKKSIDFLKKIDSLDESVVGSYLKLLKCYSIPIYTKYLYKLRTYYGCKGMDNRWDFNEKMVDFKEIGFCDIERLLEYCEKTWNIAEDDFKPLNETSIPL